MDKQKIRQWDDQPDTAYEGPADGGNPQEDLIYNPSPGSTSGTDLLDSDTDNLQFGFPDSRVRLIPKPRKGDVQDGQAESGAMRKFD